VDQVGSPNVKLLYDIYHQQITEGNLIATITANIDKISHFHVADVPGRHEPGSGEINYKNVFKSISEAGYDGFVGLEFWPECPDDDALKMLLDMTADM
jgi:hydroxypyruvate isomerase